MSAVTLTVSSDQLILNNFTTDGLVSVTTSDGANAVLNHTGDINLIANVGRNLTLNNNGDVLISGDVRDINVLATAGGISSDGVVTVRGTSTYEGQSLTLSTVTDGNVTFDIEDTASIVNDGSLAVQGSATDLSLTANSGNVTDTGTLTISDTASFVANNVILDSNQQHVW